MTGLRYRAAFTVTLCLALSAAGCASFAGGQLPERDVQGLSQQQLAVDYETEWFTFSAANENARKSLARSVREVLEESGMFSRVGYGSGQARYHLHFVMRNDGDRGTAQLTGFFSGLTLTLLPAYARDEYTLAVEVSSGGNPIKSYEYRDHMTSWIQLFLVFAMPGRGSEDVAARLRANMLRNFLYDLHHDIDSGEILDVESDGPSASARPSALG